MTPNPNPSPELREAIKSLRFQVDFQRGYGSKDIRLTRDEGDLLLAALSPQTLPAPGEVEYGMHHADYPNAPRDWDGADVRLDSGKLLTPERISTWSHGVRVNHRIVGYTRSPAQPTVCVHGIRWPHACDDCDAEMPPPGYDPLATVAAANDEGMAKAIKALKPLADVYLTGSEPDDECVIDASDFPNAGHVRAARAAIRLLSQGGGKA